MYILGKVLMGIKSKYIERKVITKRLIGKIFESGEEIWI